MSVVQWVGQILQLHKDMEQNNMLYLQGVFVTLWTIWTHKNLVVHEGKHPNPMEVTLTTQSLTCRYSEAYSNCSTPSHRKSDHLSLKKLPKKPWQLIIKVARARLKRLNRASFTYKAKNMRRDITL